MPLSVQPLQNQGNISGVATAPTSAPLSVAPTSQPTLNPTVQSAPANQPASLAYIKNSPTEPDSQSQVAPLPDDVKQKMITKLTSAQQQFPGQENQILHSLVQQNISKYPAQMGKIQSVLQNNSSALNTGNSRIDGNNNLIAASIKIGSSGNEYTKALQDAGISWKQGTPFGTDMANLNIQGDPVEAARAILSNSSAIQNYYINHTGKDVLPLYGVKNNQDFQKLDTATQNKIIDGIASHEAGTPTTTAESSTGKIAPADILNELIKQNQPQTSTPQEPTPETPPANWDANGILTGSTGLIHSIKNDFQNIQQGENQNIALEQSGKEGPVAGAFQALGAGAQGLNSLIGEGLKAGYRAVVPKMEQQGVANFANSIGANPTVKSALGSAQGYLSKLSADHPIGMANVSAATNIALALSQFIPGSEEASALDKTQGAYEDALGATKTGIQASSKVAARSGESPAEFLASAGLPPETEVVNGRRVFTTGPDSQTYQAIQDRATALTQVRDEAITKAGKGMLSSLEDARQAAIEKATEQFAGTARQQVIDHINQEFDTYAQQFNAQGRYVTLDDMNSIKKDLQGKTNYDATRPTQITQGNKIMADAAKTQVENDAEQGGIKGIRELNKYIQQHLDFLDSGNKKGILSKLNGQVIKGGKIGTYVKEGIGVGIGGTVGHALGGGLIGETLGALGGAKAGDLVSSLMQKFAAGGSRAAGILGRMATENPEVVQNFLDFLERSGEKIAPIVKPVRRLGTRNATGLIANLANQQMKK